MRTIITSFFIVGLAMAQTAVKFEATTQLVVVNISAKDKSGEAMIGLKASDFTVTEDGKPQQIKVFEFQRLEDTVLAAGDWQTFPRDDEAVRIASDGRWKRPPNPVNWSIMPRLAAPLAVRRTNSAPCVSTRTSHLTPPARP